VPQSKQKMSENNPILFSICIPAYKRIEYLNRLLDSISKQDFKYFEVIVTDDSSDDTVERLCFEYNETFDIQYYKNNPTLGTPENWNESIRHAKGDWIKIMHDDDWFTDKNSLGEFAHIINKNPNVQFVFSAFENQYLDESRSKVIKANRFRLRQLFHNPSTLLSSNVIGPPSVTIYRRDLGLQYDNKLKWLVDIDFYIRILTNSKAIYLNKILIQVGLGKEQVTQDCFRQRIIEIPENFYLLNKMGIGQLKNILIYDAWWRLIRNLEIKNLAEIRESGYSGTVDEIIVRMINRQQKISNSLLKIGLYSKFLMFLQFIKDKKSII
jgi:glycosyltransferase involved in cell wall biosynthesis